MAIPLVAQMSEASARYDELMAQLRDLDDYHTACGDLVVQGTVISGNGSRVVRFDSKVFDPAPIIKDALEKKATELKVELSKIMLKMMPTDQT